MVVHYRDELNRRQTLEQTYSVDVEAPSSLLSPETSTPQTASAPAGLWGWVRQLLGLGG